MFGQNPTPRGLDFSFFNCDKMKKVYFCDYYENNNTMTTGNKPLILVVDDISTNNILIKAILRGFEYEVISAQSGTEALEIAERNHPDLILLDIMMPVMDGYEVLARLRANEKTKDIKVVMLSALADSEDIQNAMNLGADGYLTKPVVSAALLETLDKYFK